MQCFAATNRDLQKDASTGKFHEDLFYRINTFTINLPPLRERIEDIRYLAGYFLRLFEKKLGRQGLQFAGLTLRSLENHRWKGNIRELRNVIERAVILAENNLIEPQDLPLEVQDAKMTQTEVYSMADVEKSHITKILAHTGNNKTRAAQLMGIGLATFYRKLEEYRIKS